VTATPPSWLAFPDRRASGRFPVTDQAGAVVARIQPRWTGTGFVAVDADGAPLCAASVGWGGLSSTWRATGPDAAPLLSVTSRFLRSGASVRLERGGDLVVRGSAWRRDFTVTDDAGTPVLTAVPQTSALSFRPHDFVVQQTGTVLVLPEIVAIVQTWRMIKKNESAAAAGGVAAAGAAGAASG
jgi:hypothetical protein